MAATMNDGAMAHRRTLLAGLCLLLLLFPAAARAQEKEEKEEEDQDTAEFAFNLFSDVAPILALFGEQFARQFMSESITWLDHLLFAMVPLGIVAAVTGAIRVQGPHIAKAFIGRVRENRAQVEYELMSSTSHEVGEAFNGKGIVRVMGQPQIADFLIFPDEYEEIAKTNDEHPTYGLYSLKNVHQGESPRLMELGFYHSYSYKLIKQDVLDTLWPRKVPKTEQTQTCNDPEHADLERGGIELNDLNQNDTLSSEFPSSELPPSEPPSLESSSSGSSCKFEAPNAPPNLQLNLASNHTDDAWNQKRIELIVTAILAIIIQSGLIVLAATSVTYPPLRRSIRFDAKVYGLPCYIAGSVLLSVGVGICSYAVERNTVEYAWTLPKGSEDSKRADNVRPRPNLIFLQKRQTVNDQTFNAYAMFAGPKHEIIASTRKPLRGKKSNEDEDPNHERLWELLTVAGATAAGIGFTAQFMGLRSLTYPCSIAQVIALIFMTLLRAAIRRRLGREPCHTRPPGDYELDYLATLITFYPNMRTFPGSDEDEDRKDLSPEEVFRWGVKLPVSKKYPPSPDLSPETTTTTARPVYAQPGTPTARESLSIRQPASCQQLLRVRKRLGDLCQWKSKVSDHALTLSKSIEAFMNAFVPEGNFKNPSTTSNEFTWPIRLAESMTTTKVNLAEQVVYITMTFKDEKWTIDNGTVDALLSLWMAKIDADHSRMKDHNAKRQEAKKLQSGVSSDKEYDWRRNEETKTSFYRIVGHDYKDGVLKRDLSWWVGDRFTIQGRPTDGRGENDKKTTAPDFIIGHNHNSLTAAGVRVGPQGDDGAEISVEGESPIPTILIQHLFADFVWSVSKHLPMDCLPLDFDDTARQVDIEGRDNFDSDFPAQTWYLPKLHHELLTNLVSQMEEYKMGSRADMLLCIIPAFSFHDLLPNRAILRLLPSLEQDQRSGSIATCYKSLLEICLRTEEPEKLCYPVVAYAMDFIYAAYQSHHKRLLYPYDFSEPVSKIIGLLDVKFKPIVDILVPLHNLQNRRDEFHLILEQYPSNNGTENGLLALYKIEKFDMSEDYPYASLGFSESHRKLYRWRQGSDEQLKLKLKLNDKEAVVQDIFGWTPLHYSCVFNEVGRDREFDKLSWYNIVQNPGTVKIHKRLERFKRSPLHIAASGGPSIVLSQMFWKFPTGFDEVNAALTMRDINGMTAFHHAAQSQSPECFSELISLKPNRVDATTRDRWDREPIHIAARRGNIETMGVIMDKTKSWSLSTDRLGGNPVQYLIDATINSSIKDSSEPMDQRPLDILVKWAQDQPKWTDQQGKNFLHYAAEHTDVATVQKMVAKNVDVHAASLDGRTPLDCAIRADREDTANELSQNLQSVTLVLGRDDMNMLMLATGKGYVRIVDAIVQHCDEKSLNKQGDAGRTALHHAVDGTPSSPVTNETRLEIVRLLLNKNCDPAIEDWDGCTALHLALKANNVPMSLHLLGLGHETVKRMDDSGDRALQSVCQGGCEAALDSIFQIWPNIDLSTEWDDVWDMPPLFLVCQKGHAGVARVLMEDGRQVNLNQQTNDGRTALHVCVEWNNIETLGLLLAKAPARVDINLRDKHGETPLDLADRMDREEAASMLLMHAQTSDKDRIARLKEMIESEPADMHNVIRGIFQHLTKDRMRVAFAEIDAASPYTLAIQADSAEAIAMLLEQGVDPSNVDEDGWSLEYCASRFHRSYLLDGIDKDLLVASVPQVYEKPGELSWINRDSLVSTTPCDMSGHTQCAGISNFQTNFRVHTRIRACHCISPSPSRPYFYFEVRALQNHKSGELGLGFCRRDTSNYGMPGREPGAWGYHWNSGELYIESETGIIPSTDFGRPRIFKAGDVAGVYLHMETGEGFCTLNGKKLDMGHASKRIIDGKFHIGKIYPCVWLSTMERGVGFHFEVNFAGSEKHPFMYKGPFT